MNFSRPASGLMYSNTGQTSPTTQPISMNNAPATASSMNNPATMFSLVNPIPAGALTSQQPLPPRPITAGLEFYPPVLNHANVAHQNGPGANLTTQLLYRPPAAQHGNGPLPPTHTNTNPSFLNLNTNIAHTIGYNQQTPVSSRKFLPNALLTSPNPNGLGGPHSGNGTAMFLIPAVPPPNQPNPAHSNNNNSINNSRPSRPTTAQQLNNLSATPASKQSQHSLGHPLNHSNNNSSGPLTNNTFPSIFQQTSLPSGIAQRPVTAQFSAPLLNMKMNINSNINTSQFTQQAVLMHINSDEFIPNLTSAQQHGSAHNTTMSNIHGNNNHSGPNLSGQQPSLSLRHVTNRGIPRPGSPSPPQHQHNPNQPLQQALYSSFNSDNTSVDINHHNGDIIATTTTNHTIGNVGNNIGTNLDEISSTTNSLQKSVIAALPTPSSLDTLPQLYNLPASTSSHSNTHTPINATTTTTTPSSLPSIHSTPTPAPKIVDTSSFQMSHFANLYPQEPQTQTAPPLRNLPYNLQYATAQVPIPIHQALPSQSDPRSHLLPQQAQVPAVSSIEKRSRGRKKKTIADDDDSIEEAFPPKRTSITAANIAVGAPKGRLSKKEKDSITSSAPPTPVPTVEEPPQLTALGVRARPKKEQPTAAHLRKRELWAESQLLLDKMLAQTSTSTRPRASRTSYKHDDDIGGEDEDYEEKEQEPIQPNFDLLAPPAIQTIVPQNITTLRMYTSKGIGFGAEEVALQHAPLVFSDMIANFNPQLYESLYVPRLKLVTGKKNNSDDPSSFEDLLMDKYHFKIVQIPHCAKHREDIPSGAPHTTTIYESMALPSPVTQTASFFNSKAISYIKCHIKYYYGLFLQYVTILFQNKDHLCGGDSPEQQEAAIINELIKLLHLHPVDNMPFLTPPDPQQTQNLLNIFNPNHTATVLPTNIGSKDIPFVYNSPDLLSTLSQMATTHLSLQKLHPSLNIISPAVESLLTSHIPDFFSIPTSLPQHLHQLYASGSVSMNNLDDIFSCVQYIQLYSVEFNKYATLINTVVNFNPNIEIARLQDQYPSTIYLNTPQPQPTSEYDTSFIPKCHEDMLYCGDLSFNIRALDDCERAYLSGMTGKIFQLQYGTPTTELATSSGRKKASASRDDFPNYFPRRISFDNPHGFLESTRPLLPDPRPHQWTTPDDAARLMKFEEYYTNFRAVNHITATIEPRDVLYARWLPFIDNDPIKAYWFKLRLVYNYIPLPLHFLLYSQHLGLFDTIHYLTIDPTFNSLDTVTHCVPFDDIKFCKVQPNKYFNDLLSLHNKRLRQQALDGDGDMDDIIDLRELSHTVVYSDGLTITPSLHYTAYLHERETLTQSFCFDLRNVRFAPQHMIVALMRYGGFSAGIRPVPKNDGIELMMTYLSPPQECIDILNSGESRALYVFSGTSGKSQQSNNEQSLNTKRTQKLKKRLDTFSRSTHENPHSFTVSECKEIERATFPHTRMAKAMSLLKARCLKIASEHSSFHTPGQSAFFTQWTSWLNAKFCLGDNREESSLRMKVVGDNTSQRYRQFQSFYHPVDCYDDLSRNQGFIIANKRPVIDAHDEEYNDFEQHDYVTHTDKIPKYNHSISNMTNITASFPLPQPNVSNMCMINSVPINISSTTNINVNTLNATHPGIVHTRPQQNNNYQSRPESAMIDPIYRR